MAQPVNAATPEPLVLTGFWSQLRTAPGAPVPLVMLRVTAPLAGLPPPSVRVTCGCGLSAPPPVPLPGWWPANVALAAAPLPLTLKPVLSTPIEPEAACSWQLLPLARLIWQPAKLALPLESRDSG